MGGGGSRAAVRQVFPGFQEFPERAADKFSSFFNICFSAFGAFWRFFGGFGGFRALFSDSLGVFTSVALGFVPKDPNWSGNGPKQHFQNFQKKT